MPRYRGTQEASASLVGRLLLLIARGQETSSSLSEQLGISPRTVCRYVAQLVQAGWTIERVGIPTRGEYHFELRWPRIVTAETGGTKGTDKQAGTKQKKRGS